MAEVALRLSAVNRSYAFFRAVVDVSIAVSVGERLAIIGPNGAGKTTLLGMAGGQIPCDSGRIEYFGRDITRLPDYARARLGIARSFQVPSVFAEASVEANVALAISANGQRGDRGEASSHSPVHDTLETWGLGEVSSRLPRELSHGERRRLELALAFARTPRLALLDEPTAGLTMEESTRLVRSIGELGREVTVVLVDHDMSAVFAIAERIVVMHRGSVIADDTPAAIRDNDLVSEVYGMSRGTN